MEAARLGAHSAPSRLERAQLGLLGALVGLAGWAVGELLARQLVLPGPTVLSGGEEATIPGLLGVPRLVVAVLLLIAVAIALWRRPGRESPAHDWQWGWPHIGFGLGAAITAGWALAALRRASFGPSSVGAVASISGSPNYWLITFLLGIVAGGTLSARTAGGLWLRGEQPVRYLQLAAGGLLLGAGGWIAGGCNLGRTGSPGVARLNVSSFVVVAAMVAEPLSSHLRPAYSEISSLSRDGEPHS